MSKEEGKEISKTDKPVTKSTLEDKSSSSSSSASPENTVQPKTKIVETAMIKSKSASQALEEAEAAVKIALEKARMAKEEAEAAAEEEYKAIAAEVKTTVAKKSNHTFKRQGEEIFRRDMGEPEFFLDKKDRFPRPILTQSQQELLTRKAEIPQDQTPKYVPQHVLSPEFAGVSNYERGVDSFLKENITRLEKLKKDPNATEQEIQETKNQITYLESLHENFYIGMNVFRTAKGGRDKLKA